MDHPDYEKTPSVVPSTQKPPPYDTLEQQPPPAGGPAPTALGIVAYSTLPYQSPYAPQGAAPGEVLVLQPPQPITFAEPLQPTHEPEYMFYAIFTTVCCFLPLGLVSWGYSIKTRYANRIGDGTGAQQASKMARRFAHAALGLGIVFIIAYIAFYVLLHNRGGHIH